MLKKWAACCFCRASTRASRHWRKLKMHPSRRLLGKGSLHQLSDTNTQQSLCI